MGEERPSVERCGRRRAAPCETGDAEIARDELLAARLGSPKSSSLARDETIDDRAPPYRRARQWIIVMGDQRSADPRTP